MLPVRLHFVISRLLAGGSLGFRIVLLLIPGSQISVWHSCGLSVFVVCFTSAIPIPWWYKAIIFLVHCKDYELISWPPTVLSCFLLFVLVCFVLFLFSLSAFLFLHGDSTMDYVSIQSILFWLHTVDRTEIATDLIRWICKMQLYFRFVKRPGESHLALDGRKKYWDDSERAVSAAIDTLTHFTLVLVHFLFHPALFHFSRYHTA